MHSPRTVITKLLLRLPWQHTAFATQTQSHIACHYADCSAPYSKCRPAEELARSIVEMQHDCNNSSNLLSSSIMHSLKTIMAVQSYFHGYCDNILATQSHITCHYTDSYVLHPKCRPAEELAKSIVEMRNHLGPTLMPLNKYHFFRRGILEIGNQTVISAEYFEEIPFYGPPRPCGGEALEITKFYEWKLVDCPRVRHLCELCRCMMLFVI